MFTGIISHVGRFKAYHFGKREIALESPPLSSKLKAGESLAVNGVCLSLIKKEKNILFFNLSDETLSHTNLGTLHNGDKLNLELPLNLSSLLSGHLVTGHVDTTERVLKIINKRQEKRLTISTSLHLRPYIVSKGSVALNGVSLTIAEASPSSFSVDLIPITLESTNLGELRRSDRLNLECDIIGKYLYNLMHTKEKEIIKG
ncbi:MAG: riboflavin synthase [Acidobacteriota bacterium]|nr:riboflavin synthase [Acidobacteriota bacterium]